MVANSSYYRTFSKKLSKSGAKATQIVTSCFLTAPDDLPCDQRRKVKANAIWDTGATRSCIGLGIIAKLGVYAHDLVPCETASSRTEALQYYVVLELPKQKPMLTEVLCFHEADDIGVDEVIIGMDIIAKGDFAVCGGQLFSFCCPSLPCPTDLELKARTINSELAKHL